MFRTISAVIDLTSKTQSTAVHAQCLADTNHIQTDDFLRTHVGRLDQAGKEAVSNTRFVPDRIGEQKGASSACKLCEIGMSGSFSILGTSSM